MKTSNGEHLLRSSDHWHRTSTLASTRGITRGPNDHKIGRSWCLIMYVLHALHWSKDMFCLYIYGQRVMVISGITKSSKTIFCKKPNHGDIRTNVIHNIQNVMADIFKSTLGSIQCFQCYMTVSKDVTTAILLGLLHWGQRGQCCMMHLCIHGRHPNIARLDVHWEHSYILLFSLN